WARLDLEQGYDRLEVELSADAGQSWQPLASLTGSSKWSPYDISLARHTGETIQLRFRFHSDVTVGLDGVWLDDIRLCGDTLVPSASNTATATTAAAPPPPLPPANLQARLIRGARAHLTWTPGAVGADTQVVERKIGDGDYRAIEVLPAAAAVYDDTDLGPAT